MKTKVQQPIGKKSAKISAGLLINLKLYGDQLEIPNTAIK
jgi:hypothetical protein